MDDIVVRPIHDHEWREVRALRLRALQDEVAAIAFIDTYDAASGRPDDFWQQRAVGASIEAGADADGRQFVAVTAEGDWIGSVTVLVERVGEKDFEGSEILRSAAAIVGVYLDPSYRGRGVIQRLFDLAVEWAQELGLDYVRLLVHSDNPRAQKAYEKAGFSPTGTTLDGSLGVEIEMGRNINA